MAAGPIRRAAAALAFALAAATAPAAPAAADMLSQLQAACSAPTGSAGQAASLLSTIGWRVGGNAARATEARAMVLPYLSGRGEQDLRRNALAQYRDEALAQAAEEAARSLFLTSPGGDTLMMTHSGDALDCTLALAPGTIPAMIVEALPGKPSPVTDPQMTRYPFAPDPMPTGIRAVSGAFWDPDADDYTRTNPVRPRDVDMIVTLRTVMQ